METRGADMMNAAVSLLEGGSAREGVLLLKSELERGNARGLLAFLREFRRRGYDVREVMKTVPQINWFSILTEDSGWEQLYTRPFEELRKAVDEFPEWFLEENWSLSCAFRDTKSDLHLAMVREKEVGPPEWYHHMKNASARHVMCFLGADRLAWYVDKVYSERGKDWRDVIVTSDGRNLWEWMMTCECDMKVDYAWVLLRINKRYRLRETDFRLRAPDMRRNPFLREGSVVPRADTIRDLSRVLKRINKVGNYEACMCRPDLYASGEFWEEAVTGAWSYPGPMPCTIEPMSTRDAWLMVKEYERDERITRVIGWRKRINTYRRRHQEAPILVVK